MTAIIERRLADCSTTLSAPLGHSGFGSEIHVWAVTLCYALERNASLVTTGSMVWEAACGSSAPPFTCHFGNRANPCFTHRKAAVVALPHWVPQQGRHHPTINKGYANLTALKIWEECPTWSVRNGVPFFQLAMKFLFERLSPRLLESAREAASITFGRSGAPTTLVTVHIRWGDKGKEAELLPIQRYALAVDSLVRKHRPGVPAHDIGVFVTTEDRSALTAFTVATAAYGWKVYSHAPSLLQTSGLGEDSLNMSAAPSRSCRQLRP